MALSRIERATRMDLYGTKHVRAMGLEQRGASCELRERRAYAPGADGVGDQDAGECVAGECSRFEREHCIGRARLWSSALRGERTAGRARSRRACCR